MQAGVYWARRKQGCSLSTSWIYYVWESETTSWLTRLKQDLCSLQLTVFHFSPACWLLTCCSWCFAAWVGLWTVSPPSGYTTNSRAAFQLRSWDKMPRGKYLTRSLRPSNLRCVSEHISLPSFATTCFYLFQCPLLSHKHFCMYASTLCANSYFCLVLTVWEKSEAEWNHPQEFTTRCSGACVSTVHVNIFGINFNSHFSHWYINREWMITWLQGFYTS